MLRFLLLAVLAAAPTAALVANPTCPGKPATPALRLRGGLGSVDAEQVLKYAQGAVALNGAYCVLAPEKGAEAYGIQNPLPFGTWQVKAAGGMQLSMAITGLNLLSGATLKKSVFWGELPMLYMGLSDLFNGNAAKLGFASPAGTYLFLAMSAAILYSIHTDADYADNVITAVCAFKAFNAVVGYLAPKPMMKLWGVTVSDEREINMAKVDNAMMAMQVAPILAIQQGHDVTKAIGYAWAIALMLHIDGLYVSKDMGHMDAKPLQIWMVLQALILASVFL